MFSSLDSCSKQRHFRLSVKAFLLLNESSEIVEQKIVLERNQNKHFKRHLGKATVNIYTNWFNFSLLDGASFIELCFVLKSFFFLPCRIHLSLIGLNKCQLPFLQFPRSSSCFLVFNRLTHFLWEFKFESIKHTKRNCSILFPFQTFNRYFKGKKELFSFFSLCSKKEQDTHQAMMILMRWQTFPAAPTSQEYFTFI